MRGCSFCHHAGAKTVDESPNLQPSNAEVQQSRPSVFLRFACSGMTDALSLHPLWHLDAEKIETALQNAPGKITQRQTRTARRFL